MRNMREIGIYVFVNKRCIHKNCYCNIYATLQDLPVSVTSILFIRAYRCLLVARSEYCVLVCAVRAVLSAVVACRRSVLDLLSFVLAAGGVRRVSLGSYLVILSF